MEVPLKMKTRLFIVLLSIVSLLLILTPAQAQKSRSVDMTRALMQLEPYVTTSEENGLWVQALNREQALKEGFPPEVLDLAVEIVSYQNELMQVAHDTADNDISIVKDARDLIKKYPKMEKFFKEKADKAKNAFPEDSSGMISIESFEACGDYDHPVPAHQPPKAGTCSMDPVGALISMGFHYTAIYAGQDGKDYTRGRDYNGPYGYCSTPRFRDQGRDCQARKKKFSNHRFKKSTLHQLKSLVGFFNISWLFRSSTYFPSPPCMLQCGYLSGG